MVSDDRASPDGPRPDAAASEPAKPPEGPPGQQAGATPVEITTIASPENPADAPAEGDAPTPPSPVPPPLPPSVVAPEVSSVSAEAGPQSGHGKAGIWTLTLGSVGVVYGDIGTSPLYAFREALHTAKEDGIITPVEVYGVVSLILWALTLIVTLKYVAIIVRLDNNGEGGSLSLMALARKATGGSFVILVLGVLGAALFYGDAVITPAISVLSAVEGLKLVTPAFSPYVVWITIAIIVVLFLVQSHGTARVASFFGPIMVLFFLTIGIAALPHIAREPGIFLALNPYYAVQYLATHGHAALIALGAVFLAVTGAEALFADLGHFGRRPIQRAWLGLVFPSLMLNYLGQGALVLHEPDAAAEPFFRMVPEWGLLPLVLLATCATVVAAQANITGAFSLSRQAVQLGLLPRLEVRHTSEEHSGQIYLPQVNTLIMIGVIILVLAFRSSSALASAYGVAVTGTMLITGMMAFIVLRHVWGWSRLRAAATIVPFLLLELCFLSANLLKTFEGGYVPLALAAVLVLVMGTWVKGTRVLFEKTRKTDVEMGELAAMLERSPPHRVRGTAVFLTSDPSRAPSALLHNLKHNKVLHERNIILTVRSMNVPRVRSEDRLTLEQLGQSFWTVELRFGYMEQPAIPRSLSGLRKFGFKFDIMATSFFLSRRSIRPALRSSMPIWQDKLFIALARSASDATDFFQIPTGRVVEVGTQVTL
ncbi:potassium transporter Kup [Enterovirga rhinocerotis]|uniref:Probable potassium transport system protein Kup n=1 Tax=Enterovirga rhinocerotis TaxID=1339210 RepID=A0A4R7BZH8_9HYPH|nr:potassium transporter Kup [Enterovirga rhinocerotis]TDR90175.1 KUP system potassium uptake protein [Enterovirga rhinocerotis]